MGLIKSCNTKLKATPLTQDHISCISNLVMWLYDDSNLKSCIKVTSNSFSQWELFNYLRLLIETNLGCLLSGYKLNHSASAPAKKWSLGTSKDLFDHLKNRSNFHILFSDISLRVRGQHASMFASLHYEAQGPTCTVHARST